MSKSFLCHPLSNTRLILTDNRLTAAARFLDGRGEPASYEFILDTGAVISTMSKSTANTFYIYDKDVVNPNACVGGFNKQPMYGRVIRVSHLHIGIMGVRDTLFFVPDSDDDIAEVLGSSILNGLIPIPDFDTNLIWILKNTKVPPPIHSKNLGVDVACEVLAQEEL